MFFFLLLSLLILSLQKTNGIIKLELFKSFRLLNGKGQIHWSDLTQQMERNAAMSCCFCLDFFWNKTEKGHQCHSTKRPFSFDQFLLFLFKLIITEPFSSDGLHTEDCHHHLFFFFLYFCLDVSGSICLDNRMKILRLEKYRQRYSPSESSHLPAGDWLDFEGICCWPSHRFSYITHISTTTTTTVLLFAIGSQGKLTLRTAGPLQQQQQRFSFLSLV